VPTAKHFFSSDRKDQRTIQLQRGNRDSTRTCDAEQLFILPLEMVRPNVLSWREENCDIPRGGINCRLTGFFS
jgi:hypothetical protein